jgi:hypothetical protein
VPSLRQRVVAVLGVLALLTADFTGSVAAAQSGPEYLPGEWLGEMWFWEEVTVEDGVSGPFGIQQVGSGGLVFSGTSHGFETLSGEKEEDGPATIEGSLKFAVLVRAYSEIGKTARVYEGEWYLKGSGREISIGGEVTAKGVDSGLLREGQYVGVDLEFATETTGLVVLESASCAGLNGSFTTGGISPPGGAAQVAFSAPFMAVPGGDDGIALHLDKVKALAQDLFQLVYLGSFDQEGNIPAGAKWAGAAPAQLREVLQAVWALNQAIADAGVCGSAGEDYAIGGPTFLWLADLMRDVLEAVSGDIESGHFTASELVDFYWLGASMGAFATPSETGSRLQERYPEMLSEKLFEAITSGDAASIDVIHAAACQWGWDDLKEESAT